MFSFLRYFVPSKMLCSGMLSVSEKRIDKPRTTEPVNWPASGIECLNIKIQIRRILFIKCILLNYFFKAKLKSYWVMWWHTCNQDWLFWHKCYTRTSHDCNIGFEFSFFWHIPQLIRFPSANGAGREVAWLWCESVVVNKLVYRSAAQKASPNSTRKWHAEIFCYDESVQTSYTQKIKKYH